MNVKELKEKIKDLPDDTLVVIPGSDHSYNLGYAGVAEAEVLYNKSGRHIEYMWEYYDEDNRSEEESKILEVLVIGAG